jgi:hypothetical protein
MRAGFRVIGRLALAVALAVALPAGAEVSRVEIASREIVLEGRAFGDVGAYEKLTGTVHFEFDPENPANRQIADLEHAPRNERGRVEASADFIALQPVDPSARRLALVEPPNRGRGAALAYFNRAQTSPDPVEPEHFGDGLLMRLGVTLIWIGWQWDVPEGEGNLRLEAPIARGADGPIRGLTRADWVVEEATRTLPLAHRGHVAYPASNPIDSRNMLMVRDSRAGPRTTLPRESWRFGREEGGEPLDDDTHVWMEDGFEPGRIYELVYVAEDPRVVGVGLAAVRDIISHARHDAACPFGVRRGIAFGVSQTGRLLRHFLYQGFNVDENGRRAYDGMLIHSAGAGRGSFNHRFAQPSRDAHRFSAFFYPTDIFPFTSAWQTDTLAGHSDALITMPPELRPKTFYTNTGYEYWGRAASLIHTTIDGERDVAPLETERIYHLASGQHFVGRPAREPIAPDSPALAGNPLDFRYTLRALLVRLIDWVQRDALPPPSAYPTLAAGTLTPLGEWAFPAIPGVESPRVAHEAYRADYGPLFRARGIVSTEPPRIHSPYPALVPAVDELGNERGGAQSLELLAPLATYTPWSLRLGKPGPQHELNDFTGLYIPLPRTEPERRGGAAGDPRPSLEALYGSKEAYLKRLREGSVRLVAAGFLLGEDVPVAIERLLGEWDRVMEEQRAGE